MGADEIFLGTARKWRPVRFTDVVGQTHVTKTLRNAILKKHIASAYIFAGPRGIGKTTTARILAKALNCLNPQGAEPCNACERCREINSGSSMDVIEIDGASNNSVDDVRALRENARYPPVRGNYKMYIIDEVHMLSASAFNALLKTLEEPPPHLLFVFATTEVSRVPATILSRCQRFDFHRMQIEHIVAQLKTIAAADGTAIDDEALLLIAKKAEGAMRDAQSIYDQIRTGGGDVTGARIREILNIIDQEFFFRATEIVHSQNKTAVFAYAAEMMDRGIDTQEFIAGLTEHLRNLLLASATGSGAAIETTSLYQERYRTEAQRFSPHDLLRLLNLAIETDQALRFTQQPRIHLEFALLRMATMARSVDLQELLAEMRARRNDPPPQKARAPLEPASPAHAPAEQAASSRSAAPPASAAPNETWRKYIATARDRRLKCWSSLEHNAVFLGVHGSSIRIACADEFHLDLCKKNMTELSALAREIFGADAVVELLLRPASGAATEQSAQAKRPGDPAAHGDAQPPDPLADLLAREFGAEEIR